MKVKEPPNTRLLNDACPRNQQRTISWNKRLPRQWRATFSTVAACFFILLFLALTFETHSALLQRDNHHNLTEKVTMGKRLWEASDCIGCHTLLGGKALYLANLLLAPGLVFIISLPRFTAGTTPPPDRSPPILPRPCGSAPGRVCCW